MKRYFNIVALLLIIIGSMGCKRDRLVFPVSQDALIELKIDWGRSVVDVNSATAEIYKDGKHFLTEIITSYPPVQKFIELPVGRYDIIVHNEKQSDFERNLEFKGEDEFSTFEVAAMEDTKYGRSVTRAYKIDVDTIATDRHKSFVVTQGMVDSSRFVPVVKTKAPGYGGRTVVRTINFTPRREFTEVYIVVNAMNGNGYYFTKANPVELKGMSGSFFPGEKIYSSSSVVHTLTLSSLLSVGSSKMIIFKGNMLAVGIAGRNGSLPVFKPGDYTLKLPFVCAKGIYTYDIDLVSDATRFEFVPEDPLDPNNNSDKLYIEVGVELEELISVGDVEVDVEDWGDIDIPLDGPRYLYFVSNNSKDKAYTRTNRIGEFINLPPSTQFEADPGYKFKEWNDKADGKGKSFDAGALYEMVPAGGVFYAIWEK